MIFLAGLGLTASVISLLYLSQHLIASKSNEIDQQRSVLSVEGAVQTSVCSRFIHYSARQSAVSENQSRCAAWLMDGYPVDK